MSVSVNQSRLGDYDLLQKLGEGGMGAVYKARQLSLDRIVALKVLPRRLAAQQKFLDRFVREARACARLNHPNIVAGIDVNFSDGYNYFVMEFVEGVTLRSLIQQKNGMPEEYVLRIGASMASALAHAHKAGIIHRDVKPENIMIDGAGVAKLTDLGLSKVAETQDGYLTQEGLVVGTAYYIAPEQARGEASIDGRADVYALGCTLYHAATGSPPFDAATPAVLMVKHISEKMPHPRSLQPDLSEEFCQCLSRLVARKSGDRCTAAEAAKDLETLAAGKPWTREPLPEAIVNFLPAPKEPAPQDPERDPRLSRSTLKKSVASAPVSRPPRSPVQRRRRESWTIPALVITGALLLLTYGISTYVINSSSANYPVAPAPVRNRSETPAANPEPPVLPQPTSKVSAPAQAQPPAIQSPAEVKPKDSPLVMLQLDPDADRRWRITAPEWTYANGVLAGAGHNGNAAIFRSSTLPRDFELFLTIQSKHGFHFGWSANAAHTNFIAIDYEGTLAITRYPGPGPDKKPLPLATAAEKLSNGLHEFHIVVKDTSLQLSVDGHLVASTNEGSTLDNSQPMRDLYLYAGNTGAIEYRKIQFRNLAK